MAVTRRRKLTTKAPTSKKKGKTTKSKTSTKTKRKTSTPKATTKGVTTPDPLKSLGLPKDTRRTELCVNPHGPTSLKCASKKIYGGNCTQIARVDNSTDGLAINRRVVDRIKLHGLAVYLHALNELVQHTFLNVAVVTTKRTDTISNLNTGLGTLANFFASTGVDRGEDFNAGLTPLQYFTNPINPDEFTVHHHSRHMLGAKGPTGNVYRGSTGAPVFKKVEIYVPTNIEVSYLSNTDQSVNKTYLLWWCTGHAEGVAGQSVADTITAQSRVVAYWSQKV